MKGFKLKGRGLRVGAALVLALLLLPAAPAASKETWTSLRSKNFTVIGNAPEGDLRKLAVRLEQFRHVLSLLSPSTRAETPAPTTVVLFKNHDSFKPFKPQYRGKTRENVGGYCLSSDDGTYIALSSETRGINYYELIYHEYGHSVLRNNIPRAPVWLSEGLAEFYSTFEQSGGRNATVGAPVARHVSTLKGQSLLPLRTLLTVDRKSPYYNEGRTVEMFYAQSWALVHYLMLGNGGKREGQLSQFIARLNSEMPPEENFRQSFGADYKTIEGELQSYVRRLTFPTLKLTFEQGPESDREPQSARMSDAEVQYYLADLLLRLSRLGEAEKYLRPSPRPSAATARLGSVAVRQGLCASPGRARRGGYLRGVLAGAACTLSRNSLSTSPLS